MVTEPEAAPGFAFVIIVIDHSVSGFVEGIVIQFVVPVLLHREPFDV
jgi:hypothetical protein